MADLANIKEHETSWGRIASLAARCGIPHDEVQRQPFQNVMAMVEKHVVGLEEKLKAANERIAEQSKSIDAMARLCNVKAREASKLPVRSGNPGFSWGEAAQQALDEANQQLDMKGEENV